jgi:MFS family permease
VEAAPISIPAYYRLVRDNANVRKLWLAQIISEVGDWFYTIAVYSLLFEVSGTAKSVALAFVLQVLPQFFFGPMAGAINDHLSRRKVMILADIFRAVIVVLMIFARTKEALPLLYGLLFLETLGWALFEPGRSAVIPNITRSDSETVVANGLTSTTWAFNFFFGSAVGGVAGALLGREPVLIINSLSFLVSAWLIRSMRFEEPHLAGKGEVRFRDLFDFRPIADGLRYVRDHAQLRPVILLKAGVAVMGSNWVILPTLGERVFPLAIGGLDAQRAGMLGMSALMGARGLGALIGPLTAGSWAGKDVARMRIGVALGFAMVWAGYSLLGLAGSLLLAVPCIVLAHAGGSTVWVFSSSMIHFLSEDKFRGRIFSADYMFMTLMLSISSWLAGSLIDQGWQVKDVASLTGMAALLPLVLWLLVLYRQRSLAPSPPQP